MSELRQQREGFFGTIRRIICRLLCDEGPPPPPPGPPPQEKTISFAPGHVGILAEYPPDLELTKQEIVKRVGDRLDRLELKQRETVNLAPGRVTIMRGPRLTLAWVLGDVPEARQNPARLIRFISELHEAIKKPPLEGRGYDPGPQEGPKSDRPDQAGADSVQRAAPEAGAQPGAPSAASQPSALARAARAPGAAAIRKLEADPDGFDLRAASPNWLSSGAQNHIGGGPGARPAEVSSVAPNALGPQPWEFEPLPPDLQPPGNPPAQPVEVAILDTVPSMASLLSAYTTWVGNDSTQPPQPPLQPQNPLLKGLLSDAGTGAFNVLDQTSTPANVGPAGQLDVVYSSNLPAVQLADHQYSMASHGLFIAGIIRSLPPQAKLRLIQVLNA